MIEPSQNDPEMFMLKSDAPVHGDLVIHMGLIVNFPWNQHTNSHNGWKSIKSSFQKVFFQTFGLEFGLLLVF